MEKRLTVQKWGKRPVTRVLLQWSRQELIGAQSKAVIVQRMRNGWIQDMV